MGCARQNAGAMECAHQNAGAMGCARQNAAAMGCAPSARSALVLSSGKEPLPPRFTHGKIPIAPRPSPERRARTRFVIRAPVAARARWCVCLSKRIRAPPGELRGARRRRVSSGSARGPSGWGLRKPISARAFFLKRTFFWKRTFFFGGRRPVGARGGLARRSRTRTKRPGSGSPPPSPPPQRSATRDVRPPPRPPPPPPPPSARAPRPAPRAPRPAPPPPLPRAVFFKIGFCFFFF